MSEQKNNPPTGTSGREFKENEISSRILLQQLLVVELKLDLILTILSDFVGLERNRLFKANF